MAQTDEGDLTTARGERMLRQPPVSAERDG